VSPEILQAWLALIVAAVSIGIAFYGVKLQRQNNLMAVRPLPYISCADYEDLLWVKVRNDGVGPLIINRVEFDRDGRSAEYPDLISYMPQLPADLHWSKFSRGLARTVAVGADLPLLELQLDPSKKNHVQFRDACRAALRRIEVTVSYTDMHGTTFTPVSRLLDFFALRVASSRATSA
jgi:hypothetical protein